MRIKRVKILPSVLILSLLLPLCGGGKKDTDISDTSIRGQERALPEYVLREVHHYHYEDGLLRFEITFEEGEYYASSQELYVENCHFVYYDKNRATISRGSSRSARIYGERSLVIAEKDVVIVSDVNGTVLQTDYLEWHGEEERFITESPVKITRKNGDTISGRGMIADLSLRFITIQSDVKGSFKESRS
jgi:LPS export ABC transporter protein LptC